MALSLTNITHELGPRFSLGELSLTLDSGRLTTLLGPNGAGKTTLIRMMAGLLRPNAGSIVLDETSLSTIAPIDRARRIAYVSQSWRPRFAFSVEQVVLLGRAPHQKRLGGLESADDLRAADEAIEQVGLDDLRSEPVTELSGGELQRVMIAMALAQGADILLLDEPTTHLDVGYQQEIMRLLRRLASASRKTILASLHDLNLASLYADRILLMRDGTIAADGEPADVLTPENLARTFGADLAVTDRFYGSRPLVRFPEADHG